MTENTKILQTQELPPAPISHTAFSDTEASNARGSTIPQSKVDASRKSDESRLTSRRLSLRRCQMSLNVSLEQLNEILSSEEHYFAPLAHNRKQQEFVKLHMNGTSNSRRFIHVYLWWARLLGPHYPISDDMLQGRVWKHLRCTCGEGILDTRGHRRPADPLRVCIGPGHYALTPGADLLSMIREDAENLCREVDIDNDHALDFLARLRAELARGSDLHLDTLVTFIRENCPLFSFGPGQPQPFAPRPERQRTHSLSSLLGLSDAGRPVRRSFGSISTEGGDVSDNGSDPDTEAAETLSSMGHPHIAAWPGKPTAHVAETALTPAAELPSPTPTLSPAPRQRSAAPVTDVPAPLSAIAPTAMPSLSSSRSAVRAHGSPLARRGAIAAHPASSLAHARPLQAQPPQDDDDDGEPALEIVDTEEQLSTLTRELSVEEKSEPVTTAPSVFGFSAALPSRYAPPAFQTAAASSQSSSIHRSHTPSPTASRPASNSASAPASPVRQRRTLVPIAPAPAPLADLSPRVKRWQGDVRHAARETVVPSPSAAVDSKQAMMALKAQKYAVEHLPSVAASAPLTTGVPLTVAAMPMTTTATLATPDLVAPSLPPLAPYGTNGSAPIMMVPMSFLGPDGKPTRDLVWIPMTYAIPPAPAQ